MRQHPSDVAAEVARDGFGARKAGGRIDFERGLTRRERQAPGSMVLETSGCERPERGLHSPLTRSTPRLARPR